MITEEQLLAAVKAERQGAIGFDDASELQSQRQIALEYYNGKMIDIEELENRSKVKTSEVRDAIQTLLPDVMEVLADRDNVVVFEPSSAEDIEACKVETDVVRRVIYSDNNGFMLLQTAVLDACMVKTGVLTWAWEDAPTPRAEKYTGKTVEEVMLVMKRQGHDIAALAANEDDPNLWDFTLRRPKSEGRVVIDAVPPEDFAVAEDTVYLPTSTYCAMRVRKRAQDILAMGIERELVDQLTPYEGVGADGIRQARDTVSETDEARADAEGPNDLRTVEVTKHHIRLYDDETDEMCLFEVLTGNDEALLLDWDEVSSIPYSSGSPYLNPHRFIGVSVADVMIEIQRISTALMRTGLDSGYYAHNQRMEIAEPGIGPTTLTDILDNRPGVPVRTRVAGQLAPIQAGPLNVDIAGLIEQVAVMGEKRSGIVRNAQGLNPDTLHDTAKGAQILIQAANKRMRFLIRNLVEMMVKPMALGVHDLLRRNSTAERTFNIKKKFIPINPSLWATRNDMTIDIGSDREFEITAMRTIIELQGEAVASKQATGVDLVTPNQLYNSASRMATLLGAVDPDMYFTDPTAQMQQMAENPQPPPPDPKMVEVEGRLAIENQKLQLTVEEAQAKLTFQMQEAKTKSDLDLLKMQLDFAARTNQVEMEVGLKSQIAEMEAQLAQIQIAVDARLQEQDLTDHDSRERDKTNLQVQSNIGGEPG